MANLPGKSSVLPAQHVILLLVGTTLWGTPTTNVCFVATYIEAGGA